MKRYLMTLLLLLMICGLPAGESYAAACPSWVPVVVPHYPYPSTTPLPGFTPLEFSKNNGSLMQHHDVCGHMEHFPARQSTLYCPSELFCGGKEVTRQYDSPTAHTFTGHAFTDIADDGLYFNPDPLPGTTCKFRLVGDKVDGYCFRLWRNAEFPTLEYEQEIFFHQYYNTATIGVCNPECIQGAAENGIIIPNPQNDPEGFGAFALATMGVPYVPPQP